MNIDILYDGTEEEKLEWWNSEIVKNPTLQDYEGGGGPEDEQNVMNTMALFIKLRDLNSTKFSINPDFEYASKLWGGIEPQIRIRREDGEELVAGYDRWGIAVDGLESCDQASLDYAISEILSWANL